MRKFDLAPSVEFDEVSPPMDHPPEVDNRPAVGSDIEQIARVHVASWRETYCGIIPSTYLEALRIENRVDLWRHVLVDRAQDHTTFVADAVGVGVVGFISAGPVLDDSFEVESEIHTVYLLADYHKRGLGRRLFGAAMAALADQGVRSVGLWVLAANPSLGFYLHLGGRETQRKPFEIGGDSLEEVALLWDDLDSLATECRGSMR